MTTLRPVEELAVQVLKRDGSLRIKARGGSMTPFIWDGDVVEVRTLDSDQICVGDVICYETRPGRLFLHRVVARDGDRFVAKGDALAFTETVERAQVLGTIVAIQRAGKVRRLDTLPARWRNRAIAFLSPVLPRILAVALGMRRAWRVAFGG